MYIGVSTNLYLTEGAMDEEIKELREELLNLYKLEEKLKDDYIDGRISLGRYNRIKPSIGEKIAVYEKRLKENLLQEKIRLHQNLRELNKKHRDKKLEDKLYESAYIKLNKEIKGIEQLLEETRQDRGIHSYIRREEDVRSLERKKGKYKTTLTSWVILLLIIAVLTYSFTGIFYVDQRAIMERLNLSEDGLLEYEGDQWRITFESNRESIYEGKVRHISRNNEKSAPMMTHDILVTSGEYADENKVQTSVRNHYFTWRSKIRRPSGKINLIHGVPANISIYDKIEKIEYGNDVLIEGYEIERITNLQNKWYWKDRGCNTLYITNVEIRG